jgi:hypothetical protein
MDNSNSVIEKLKNVEKLEKLVNLSIKVFGSFGILLIIISTIFIVYRRRKVKVLINLVDFCPILFVKKQIKRNSEEVAENPPEETTNLLAKRDHQIN